MGSWCTYSWLYGTPAGSGWVGQEMTQNPGKIQKRPDLRWCVPILIQKSPNRLNPCLGFPDAPGGNIGKDGNQKRRKPQRQGVRSQKRLGFHQGFFTLSCIIIVLRQGYYSSRPLPDGMQVLQALSRRKGSLHQRQEILCRAGRRFLGRLPPLTALCSRVRGF